MKWILGGLLCLALNAHALTINFNGELTSATAGSYGFTVGDLFAGSIEFTGDISTVSAATFVGATLSVDGAPDISFGSSALAGSSFSPTMIVLICNPLGFNTTIILRLLDGHVSEDGVVYLSDNPARGPGNFSAAIYAEGKQNVPDASPALGLLAIAGATLVGLRRFQRV